MKRVIFFGIYDPNYARNRVLKNGFERNGWEVRECRVDPRAARGLTKFFKLFLAGLSVRRQRHELVVVCFPGQSVVWLARLLFGRQIIFDAFLSMYDSNVFDRKVYAADSFAGRKDFFLDRWSCKLAHRVLLDTNQHIDYFVTTFGVPCEKFIRVWISADDTVFFPTSIPEAAVFTAHFHGHFIPLQGIQYIVEAAHLLRHSGIRFRIVGGGQEAARIDALIRERDLGSVIERVGKVAVTEVPGHMANAQVVLGIFGDTEKTLRVIPNKVYEAMAMGKAIITADTPAMRELEGAADSLVLVPVANAKALATAILTLHENPDLRTRLGHDARALFERELKPERIVEDLVTNLRKML